MEIYFIRHGQTQFNKEHRHQSSDTKLTALGREQAESIAPIVKALRPTHIITSPYARASETAEIATSDLGLPIESNELFVELIRPTHVAGKTHKSFVSLLYILKWFYSNNEIYWATTKGESRNMFLKRQISAKDYIETLPDDSCVVVFSHSIFINFFVEHICNEERIPTWRAVLLFIKILSLDNSSITHVSYSAELAEGTCKWNLVSFDDDTHVVT